MNFVKPTKIFYYTVQPSKKEILTDSIYACETVPHRSKTLIFKSLTIGVVLMTVCGVNFFLLQVISWRMLNRVLSAGWSQDLLDMMYLDYRALEWAKALGDGVEESTK